MSALRQLSPEGAGPAVGVTAPPNMISSNSSFRTSEERDPLVRFLDQKLPKKPPPAASSSRLLCPCIQLVIKQLRQCPEKIPNLLLLFEDVILEGFGLASSDYGLGCD